MNLKVRAARGLLDLLGLRLLVAFNRHLGDDVERFLSRCAVAPFRIGVLLYVIGIVPGGALFSIFEPNASLIDGMYWSTVVMPTVGFGDFSPVTVEGRWVYECVVLLGKLSEYLVAGAFMGAIVKRVVRPHHSETAELDDDFDHLIAQLEGLKAVTNHPRVKEALREIHNEKGPAWTP